MSSAEFRRRFLFFLLPGLYQSALTFLALPLTTRILGPADYALFSVTSAICMLLVTIAQLGSVFILAQRYPSSNGEDRRRLVSTIFFQCLTSSLCLASLMLLTWPVVRDNWSVVDGVTLHIMALVAVAMVGTSLSTLVGTLAVFGHAPGYFALITMVKATVSVAVVLVALFFFDLRVVSLFLGQFAAGLLDLIGSCLIILPFLGWRFDRTVASDCLRLGGWSSIGQLSMQGRQLLERSVLSTTAGLHPLGLFVHAQQYQNYAMLAVRPVQQALVPVMLEEASASVAGFHRTDRAVRMLFATLTMLALAFAFLGREVIHIMTNGKFDEAAPYAALLIGVLLLQSSGRPQVARLLSEGRGRHLAACNIIAVAAAAVALIALSPLFGLPAAVGAIYVQYAVFRLSIGISAARLGCLPFQDLRGFAGIAAVGGAVAVVQIWDPDIAARALLLLVAMIAIAVFNRDVFRDMAGQALAYWRTLSGFGAAITMRPRRYRHFEGRER